MMKLWRFREPHTLTQTQTHDLYCRIRSYIETKSCGHDWTFNAIKNCSNTFWILNPRSSNYDENLHEGLSKMLRHSHLQSFTTIQAIDRKCVLTNSPKTRMAVTLQMITTTIALNDNIEFYHNLCFMVLIFDLQYRCALHADFIKLR